MRCATGIAEDEAETGDHKAHEQGATEERDVDAALLRLPGDRAVREALQVDGVQVVARREALARRADRVPRRRLRPRGVQFGKRLAPRAGGRLVEVARGAREHPAQPALEPVGAPRHLSQRAGFPRPRQLPGDGLVRRLGGQPLPVPGAQRRERLRERVGDNRIVYAPQQHRPQRGEEGDAGEDEQRQDEHYRPPPITTRRAGRPGPGPAS